MGLCGNDLTVRFQISRSGCRRTKNLGNRVAATREITQHHAPVGVREGVLSVDRDVSLKGIQFSESVWDGGNIPLRKF